MDTRSDVYSMGVLLYELLTGTTPFDKSLLKGVGVDEIRRMIRETEPPRPSQRIGMNSSTLRAAKDSTLSSKPTPNEVRARRELQGELDWIVMKALEKERNRRYESPSEFAADITRYLNNEQVQACPPSKWYRIKKFVRRNRALLATSTLIAVSLLAGISASLWQAFRATEAEKRAAAGGVLARQAVDDMYTEVAEQWLAERGGLTLMQRHFLEKALHFYTKFSEGAPQDLELQVHRLSAMERVGALQAKLGNFADAETTNRRLIEACLTLRASHANVHKAVIVLASARRQLGEAQQKTGKLNEAIRSYEQSFADLKSIIEKHITDEAVCHSLAHSLQQLASKLDVVGRSEQAEECIQASIKTSQRLAAEDRGTWEYRFGSANALKTLGIKRMWWGKQKKEAETTLLEAEKQLIDLLKEKPIDRKCRLALATTYQNLGVLNHWKGDKLEDTANFDRKSLALVESLARDYPMDTSILEQLSSMQGNVASSIVAKSGEHTEESVALLMGKMKVLKQLCIMQPDVIGYESDFIRTATWNLIHLCKEGKLNEASVFSDECLGWIETLPRPAELNFENAKHFQLISLLTCYSAMVRMELGRYEAAAAMLEKLPIQSRAFDERLVTNEGYDGSDRHMHYLIDCNAVVLLLQRPAEILKQCASNVERDAVLDLDERSKRAAEYRMRATDCERESAKAISSFSETVRAAALKYEELRAVLFTIYDEDLMRNGFVESLFAAENRLVRNVTLRNSREIAKAIFQLPDASDSLLVGLLTAGDEDFRSGEIAHKLARNKFEKEPQSGMSKQDYAWALYRVGKYQECYEMLKDTEFGDSERSAILAMALWQLGRHEEAKERLDVRYETALAAYLNRLKVVRPGTIVWPTADMLLRLDREARAMLSLPAKAW